MSNPGATFNRLQKSVAAFLADDRRPPCPPQKCFLPASLRLHRKKFLTPRNIVFSKSFLDFID
ncbi:hypothetical protein OII46_16955, partial [Achromobacter ruhlandii]|nr:hypothetical protein [Achromobacter ruhlandii]